MFLINTLLFGASVFVPAPWRFHLRGVASLLSLLLPVYLLDLGRRDPQCQAEIDVMCGLSPSLVEPLGLFTIIVPGAVIFGVVVGVSEHHHPSWLVGGTATLGTLIAISPWWVYFDFASHHRPYPDTAMISRWLYLHLPLTMGITAVGAAVLNVVEHAGEHLPYEGPWLLVSAIATTLIGTTGLLRTIQLSPERQCTPRAGGCVMLVSAGLIAILGFTKLDIIRLMMLLVLLMLAPVFYAFRVWLDVLGSETPSTGRGSH